jgi:hypothetical protein
MCCPSILFLTGRYENGKIIEDYGARENRGYEDLSKYIDQKMAALPKIEEPSVEMPPPTKLKTVPGSSGPQPNPDGVSIPLTFESFSKFITPLNSRSVGAGWFVKFYVPGVLIANIWRPPGLN